MLRQATLSFGRTLSLSTGAVVRAAPPEMEGSEADSFCPSPSNQSLQGSMGCASAQSSTSSILSSAEAYTRRAAAGAGTRGASASEVRVVLALRFLSCQGHCLGVVTSLSLKRVALTIPTLKAKRRKFDDARRLEILKMAETHGVRHAVRIARNTPGYEQLDRRQLRRWRALLLKPNRRMGRPTVSDAFNSAVLNNLMMASVDGDLDQNRVEIEANVAYGYDMIRLAAQQARKGADFLGDKKLQNYKFSNSWVRTWVKNMQMRRRRVTTVTKVLPPPRKFKPACLLSRSC